MGNITSKFPIPGTCDALGLHVNCTPAFDGNSPHVVMLGNVAPGNFEPDPDIAGKGVLYAFFIPNAIILGVCLLIILLRIDYLFDEDLDRETIRVPTYVVQSWRYATSTIGSKSIHEHNYSGRETPHYNPPYRPLSRPTNHTGQYYPINGHQYKPRRTITPTVPTLRPSPPAAAYDHPNNNQHHYPSQGNQYNNSNQNYNCNQYNNGGQYSLLQHPGVISQQTTQKGLWQSQEDIHYHVEEEYDGIPEPDNENPAFNDPPPRPRTRREVIYDYFEAAMLSISDSQLLLGTAQCISFAVTGICTTSQYHYTIALHLVLSACYSSLLAVVLVRDYLRAPLAASVRFILILVLVAALGYVEFYVPGTAEVRHSSGDKTAEDMPAMGRNQSSILLKASCFLDPGLVRDVFDALNKTQDPVAEFHALAINQPLQLNQSRDLQADQSQIQGQDAALGQRRLDALGFQDTYSSPHRAYYIGLVVLFAWAVIVLSVQGCSKFRHRNDRYVDRETARRDLLKGGKKRKFCWLLSWLGPWITAVIVLATIWTYTEDLKRWVAASGWLALRNGKNPEDTVQGLGQVAPLVFVIGVAIATLEKWVRR